MRKPSEVIINRKTLNEEEMLLIYTKLGNGCNERLASMFITTGFDMDLLKG